MPNQSLWDEDEIKLIDFMRDNPQYVSNSYRNWGKLILDNMWSKISMELNIPESECRMKWNRIKKRYAKILRDKNKYIGIKTKYLDGRLEFLNKHFWFRLNKGNQQVAEDVVVIDSDEESQEKDFFTLDLKTIENLLVLRGVELQKDFKISGKNKILSVVSKRIDETLSSYTNNRLNKIVDKTGTMSTNDENTQKVKFPHNSQPGFDRFSLSGNMKRVVSSTSLVQDSSKTSTPLRQNNNKDDMETIFDIHRNSDPKTFYKKLGIYMERFSKEKCEEIRLKTCFLVAQIELKDL